MKITNIKMKISANKFYNILASGTVIRHKRVKSTNAVENHFRKATTTKNTNKIPSMGPFFQAFAKKKVHVFCLM